MYEPELRRLLIRMVLLEGSTPNRGYIDEMRSIDLMVALLDSADTLTVQYSKQSDNNPLYLRAKRNTLRNLIQFLGVKPL